MRARRLTTPEVVGAGLTAIPPLVMIGAGGRDGLFRWAAADTFYYLIVAREWARSGLPSTDGVHATNGFHPLWQVIITVIQRMMDLTGGGPTAVLAIILVLQAVLLGAAVFILGRTVRFARGGQLGWWWVLVPFGVQGLVLMPFWLNGRHVNPYEGSMPLYGTMWSFVNGMESAVAIFVFALLAHQFVRKPPGSWRAGVAFGILTALLVFARLDLIFAAGMILIVGLGSAWGRQHTDRRAAWYVAIGVFAVAVASYLVVNHLYAGSALPISGSAKSSFPRVDGANGNLIKSFYGSMIRSRGLPAFIDAYRVIPITVTGVVAALHLGMCLVHTRRRGWACIRQETARNRWSNLLAAVAVGVFSLALYDLLYVPIYQQGHWYWPVSTVYLTLVTVAFCDRFLSGWKSRYPVLSSSLHQGGIAIAVLVMALAAVVTTAPRNYHARYAAFARDIAPQLRTHYRKAGVDLKIVSMDDGIDAWALDVPSMSGTLLVADREALEAYRSGRYLDLAEERGFTRFTTVAYGVLGPDSPALLALQPDAEEQFMFDVDYISDPMPTGSADRAPMTVVMMSRRPEHQ